jgi:pyruvate dehydrogenase E1 component alpha subunit
MVLIRQAEERLIQLFAAGRMPGFIHSYIGEEATAAGVCAALRPDDYLTSTHRGHGHILAKGGDPVRFFAELYGKASGYCRGKGGSMHVTDLDLGILGANGIVGAGIPIAAGAALACRMQGLDRWPWRSWGRRDRHRRVPRGAEHGVALGGAGDLRL